MCLKSQSKRLPIGGLKGLPMGGQTEETQHE